MVIDIPHQASQLEPEQRVLTNESCQITVGDAAQAVVWLTVQGDVEITAVLRESSTLTIVCVQTVEAVLKQSSTVGMGSTVHWQNISLAPGQAELTSELTGEAATSNVDWILYAKHAERCAIRAENVFEAPQGRGEITMRTVAADNATVGVSGMITIGLNGSGTDTYLTEEVLMLDSSAKVDAIPGLEIKTNDVKASHSATVSKVTPEDVFYFAARGIPEATARQMYIQGFVSAITDKLPEVTQEMVAEAIEQKLLA